VLRTQTSAHQVQTLGRGHHSSIILGEVFRKDQIDATHYPVFHQMEAFTLYKVSDLLEFAEELLAKNQQPELTAQAPDVQNKDYRYFGSQSAQLAVVQQLVINDLKETHTNLFRFLLNNSDCTSRWNPDYFPFTEPSYELEIYLKDRWIEVLGSGVIHKDVLRNANIDPEQYIGWASGVGLERICMILFDIPDIRLFWSQDPRFLSQFEKGRVSRFKPFSKYPSCFKDISFYVAAPHQLPQDVQFEENELYEVLRAKGGDLIENVQLVDFFHNKKLQKISRCYRVHYRSLERTLLNEEIDKIQFAVRHEFVEKLGVELR